MSTREPPLPTELTLLPVASPASAPDLGGRAPPSPGIAFAAARVPGSPTLPDWDPSTLTRVVFQVASELFGAPPSPYGVVQPPTNATTPGAMPASVTPASTPFSSAPTPPYSTPSSATHAGTPFSSAPPSATTPPYATPSSPAPASAPHAGTLFSSAPSSAPTPPYATPSIPAPASATPASTPFSSAATPSYAPTASAATPPYATPSSTTTPLHAPAASPTAAGATRAPPTSAPRSTASNPFFAPLRFDSLMVGEALDVDLLRLAFVDMTDQAAAPYFVPVEDRATVAAPAHVMTVDAHDPVVDLDPERGAFDAHAIRREFPILMEPVNGKRLVWLDNAATTQKPRAVIDRLSSFYQHENSNIHRAAHTLAARATDAYESARKTTQRFLNAPSAAEIVFVRGATEGINLVAQSWGRRNVAAGDDIVITWLEHHANIVPWQQLASETGARLRVAPVDDRGQIILDEYEKLLGPRTRLVALPHVSNALGTITPAREMIAMAHRHGARVLLDGAQSVSHMRVDMQQLDCDFFVFSGHKVFAPTGIGVLFGKSEVLDAMPPWQGGGNMIEDVTFEKTIYQRPPMRFEAGTGNIADAAGLGTALEWLTRVGLENVERHEHDLLVYATQQLSMIPGLRILGTAPDKAGVMSFVMAGHSTADIAAALDKEGIAVRGGHHCAQPILRRLGVESSVRASLAPYNVREDIDALTAALRDMQGGRTR